MPQGIKRVLRPLKPLVRHSQEKLLQASVPALRARKRAPGPKRSLWTGAPILNMTVNAKAERLLGVETTTLVYGTYFITNRFDYNLAPWMSRPGARHALPYGVFLWAASRFDRFHFYCDQGLLPPPENHFFNPVELEILKKLGKEVFFWTYGSDVRTRETTLALGRYNCCMECPTPGFACVCDEGIHEKNYSVVQKHATAVFSMGDMIEYTPGSVNDVFFWPVDLDRDQGKRYAPAYPDPGGKGPVRIVHAPNHRHFKGTRFIVDAVEALKARGENVELVLVEKVPNDQALAIYRSADIVFDQCIIGFHGYFAMEAMAMGKPVVCYIRKPEAYLLEPDECPIVSARADEAEEVLKGLITDRARLHDLGVRGRRYVEKHHSLNAFAERLKNAYLNQGVSPS